MKRPPTMKRDSLADLACRMENQEHACDRQQGEIWRLERQLRQTELYLGVAILACAIAIILPDVAAYACGEG